MNAIRRMSTVAGAAAPRQSGVNQAVAKAAVFTWAGASSIWACGEVYSAVQVARGHPELALKATVAQEFAVPESRSAPMSAAHIGSTFFWSTLPWLVLAASASI